MINEFVAKLIDNLPDDIKNSKEPLVLDLVLDGGAFNGSYLVGALYFLKEMEKRNYVKINRISGCSVGAIAGFLYYIDGLHLMTKLYEVITADFRQSYKLQFVKELHKYLGPHIPHDICQRINGKFFITYHNIKKGKKPVRCKYANVADILKTIVKSSYIPFLIDGNVLYEKKYMDGITPFVFNTEANKKILYLDLFGADKISNLLNVKNEKSNYHRVLSGLLDIHSFYIKQTNTQMCSYVNDWSLISKGGNYIKWLVEKLIIYFIYFVVLIGKQIPVEFRESVFCKLASKILYDIFIIILESRCL
jgi:hypothetical protein